MRSMAAALVVVLVATGCTSDATGPREGDTQAALQEMALLSYGAVQGGEPGQHLMPRLSQLPPALALSAEQAAAIRELVTEFMEATADDRTALAEVMSAARAAKQAGATVEEIRAILETGAAARQRLRAAQQALHAAILELLTPAQRTWIAQHAPHVPLMCSTLTDAQRTEISGLIAAYEEANAVDINLVRAVHERVRAALQAGASRAEIEAILGEAREAVQRLRTARAELMQQIMTVLSPQQRVAGCFR